MSRYHRVLQMYYMKIIDELNEVEITNFENFINQTKSRFANDTGTEFYKGIFYKLRLSVMQKLLLILQIFEYN